MFVPDKQLMTQSRCVCVVTSSNRTNHSAPAVALLNPRVAVDGMTSRVGCAIRRITGFATEAVASWKAAIIGLDGLGACPLGVSSDTRSALLAMEKFR